MELLSKLWEISFFASVIIIILSLALSIYQDGRSGMRVGELVFLFITLAMILMMVALIPVVNILMASFLLYVVIDNQKSGIKLT